MVSVTKIGDNNVASIKEFCGLSTDTKPVDTFDDDNVTNGSLFLEMDTKKVYIFSESNSTWYEM